VYRSSPAFSQTKTGNGPGTLGLPGSLGFTTPAGTLSWTLVAPQPLDFTLSPTSGIVTVSNRTITVTLYCTPASRTISLCDTIITSPNGSIIGHLNRTADCHPWGEAYDPDNGCLYVTEDPMTSPASQGYLTYLGPSQRTPTSLVIPGGLNPQGIAWARSYYGEPVPWVSFFPDGILMIADSGSNSVSVFGLGIPGLSGNRSSCFAEFIQTDSNLTNWVNGAQLTDPWDVVFDAQTGLFYVTWAMSTSAKNQSEIFVANEGASNVSVISDSTNTVVATAAVGLGPVAMAYDSGKGEVFVVNIVETSGTPLGNVSVISDASNTVVATVPVGVNPIAAAYDSGKGEVFVANSGSNNVSVISDATNTVMATVPVGSSPDYMVYDAGKGDIFVENSNSHNVSVISDANDKVVATVAIGAYLGYMAYDSGIGEIFLTTEPFSARSHGNVSVISDSTYKVVATVAVGAIPGPLAYDSMMAEVFVANGGSANVSVISDSTNTVVATVAVGPTPSFMAYDSAKSEVFVVDAGIYSNFYGNVSVVSDVSNTVMETVAVGTGPIAIAFDSGKGEVFVVNELSNNVSVISDATNTVKATVSVGFYPVAVAYGSSSATGTTTNAGVVEAFSGSNPGCEFLTNLSTPEGLSIASLGGFRGLAVASFASNGWVTQLPVTPYYDSLPSTICRGVHSVYYRTSPTEFDQSVWTVDTPNGLAASNSTSVVGFNSSTLAVSDSAYGTLGDLKGTGCASGTPLDHVAALLYLPTLACANSVSLDSAYASPSYPGAYGIAYNSWTHHALEVLNAEGQVLAVEQNPPPSPAISVAPPMPFESVEAIWFAPAATFLSPLYYNAPVGDGTMVVTNWGAGTLYIGAAV
jgi:YVTN family beta-propeller protein